MRSDSLKRAGSRAALCFGAIAILSLLPLSLWNSGQHPAHAQDVLVLPKDNSNQSLLPAENLSPSAYPNPLDKDSLGMTSDNLSPAPVNSPSEDTNSQLKIQLQSKPFLAEQERGEMGEKSIQLSKTINGFDQPLVAFVPSSQLVDSELDAALKAMDDPELSQKPYPENVRPLMLYMMSRQGTPWDDAILKLLAEAGKKSGK